ncbi:MAG: D-alanyl-D-alanine carboxypeptidase [Microbacterium sp.]
MTPDESPAPSRRALRERAVPGADDSGSTDPTGPVATAIEPGDRAPAAVTTTMTDEAVPTGPATGAIATPPTVTPASAVLPAAAPAALVAPPATTSATPPPVPRSALTWVDERTVAAARPGAAGVTAEPDLLGRPPRRSPLRAGVVIPTLAVAAIIGVYAATTLLWPLHAVPPVVEATVVEPIAAPAAIPAWPATGSAAISVAGVNGSLASSPDAHTIASITKLVTALAVLEEMPLNPGEQGPEFRFTSRDRTAYWSYRSNGESSLDVPVGGTLTEYQLLEGMLIGSANNYADRLAGNLWPSDAVFANAANGWLAAHGVPGIQVAEPTGLDPRNVATPEALLTLAKKALANPVIAGIVAKPSTELPGAGVVVNSNGLLADPGVIGLKTGTLDTYNLLSAKNVTVGDTVVRMYASVLGQPDDATRLAASRALYAQLEAELQPRPSVEGGTTIGHVTTPWGEQVAIITAGDADVILWNGGSGAVTTAFDLGDSRERGEKVGTLSVDGPLNGVTVDAVLAHDIPDPSPWWRLAHPLQLLGLAD